MGLLSALMQWACSLWTATLVFAGDAMQHQSQLDAARQPDGTYDYTGCLDAVAPYISAADYAVVNLETAMAGGRHSGYPCFNAPEAYAEALADAGFDLFLTANNHTLDRQSAGMVRTLDALDRLGLDHIGTFRSASERDSVLPFIKDVNGFKIAFLNYTYGTNGIEPDRTVVVDYINRTKMAADMSRARSAGAELVCVAVHWGDEYKLRHNRNQTDLANFLFDKGADMVIGGHPHVVQPWEFREGADGRRKLLVYSLGNFFSGMRTTDTRGGAMLRVRLGRDEKGTAIIDTADYELVYTQMALSPGENYKLLVADSVTDPRWTARCRAFLTNARRVMQ